MNTISIEHKISQTEKEIYHFELSGDTWIYTGITYSNRDGVGDVWGEKWENSKAISKIRNKELNSHAKKHNYNNIDELIYDLNDYEYDERLDGIRCIEKKYYATRNKTIHGKIRSHGCSWGRGCRDKKYQPKMSEEKIKLAILKKISKIKVKI